jgi:hypothetical protein
LKTIKRMDLNLPVYKRKYKERRNIIGIEPIHSRRGEDNGELKQIMIDLKGY